jgi:hypothetical protein
MWRPIENDKAKEEGNKYKIHLSKFLEGSSKQKFGNKLLDTFIHRMYLILNVRQLKIIYKSRVFARRDPRIATRVLNRSY